MVVSCTRFSYLSVLHLNAKLLILLSKRQGYYLIIPSLLMMVLSVACVRNSRIFSHLKIWIARTSFVKFMWHWIVMPWNASNYHLELLRAFIKCLFCSQHILPPRKHFSMQATFTANAKETCLQVALKIILTQYFSRH